MDFLKRFLGKVDSDNSIELALKSQLSFRVSQIDTQLIKLVGGTVENISNFNTLTDKALSTLEGDSLALSEEISYLQAYIKCFQQYQLSGCYIEENYQTASVKDLFIQPFILIPLVQNALHYGLHLKERPIRLRLSVNAETLRMEVSNRVNHYLLDQSTTDIMTYFKGALAYHYAGRHELILNSNSNLFKASLTIRLD